MKKSLSTFPVILLVLLLLKGCNFENAVTPDEQSNAQTGNTNDPGRIFVKNLLTSPTNAIGKAIIWNDSVNIYIRLVSNSNYYFKNIRISFSSTFGGIPLSGNCPDYNNFQYKVLNLPNNTKIYTKTLPLSILPSKFITRYIAVQADVETVSLEPNCTLVWADGNAFPNCSTFSKYFIYTIKN